VLKKNFSGRVTWILNCGVYLKWCYTNQNVEYYKMNLIKN